MARTRHVTKRMVIGALALCLATPALIVGADAQPAFIATDADWLTTVNYFRDMSGLSPVTEDTAMSAGAYQHSCYMLTNGIAHDEVPGNPGYTAEGDLAGNNGNVAVSSAFNASARSHLELWMTGPFHAIGMLRPNLSKVGFGKCDNQNTSPWRSGATLDVLRGLGAKTPMTSPILFPGNGMTTSLNKFIVESPDPMPFCGWTGSAGLPVIAMMPESVGNAVSASISGANGPLTTCALSPLNTTGVAQQILQGDNAVVAIPRAPLEPGTYTVTVTTQARTVQWSFTVDPAAALGLAAPSQAQPTGSAVGYRPLTPARVVDTRQGQGATRLAATVSKRIQISGFGGVADGSSAISANFTIVGPASAGYLTVWNCSDSRPVVSTLNFTAGDVASNGATIPLDATGGLCVYSNVAADLVVDVNGSYGSAGDARFTPVSPVRLLDTRESGQRLTAGQTLALQIGGAGGVPNGVAAATLNVTSVDAGSDGFVTVYACDSDRPTVSNLNPRPGRVRPNLVVTPVSADGKVCLYSMQDVDLVVDVTGYLKLATGKRFTPSTPFRLIDTRDHSRPELQAGTGGQPVHAGQTLEIQIAGVRGVPTNAKAVSMNLTVTGAAQAGYLTAWPCGDRPTTSTANYTAGDAVSNGAQLPLSSTGTLCIYSMQEAHVIVDINGWWS
jgi:hypothetical protein